MQPDAFEPPLPHAVTLKGFNIVAQGKACEPTAN